MTVTGRMRALDERRGAVRVEQVYDTDLDDLWDACTNPERLQRWIATITGDLRVGGTVHASFTSAWSGPGRIEECEAPRHLLLIMEPDTDEETELEAWLSEAGERDHVSTESRPVTSTALDEPDRTVLLAALAYQRASVRAIVGGLSEQHWRRS